MGCESFRKRSSSHRGSRQMRAGDCKYVACAFVISRDMDFKPLHDLITV